MNTNNQERERFDILVMDWARGQLTPSEAAEFDAILANNPEWREEAEELRSLREIVRQAPAPRAPEGLLANAIRRAKSDEVIPDAFAEDEQPTGAVVVPMGEEPAATRRKAAPWGLAAAAALAVVAGGSALLLMRGEGDTTDTTYDLAMVDTAPEEAEERSFASRAARSAMTGGTARQAEELERQIAEAVEQTRAEITAAREIAEPASSRQAELLVEDKVAMDIMDSPDDGEQAMELANVIVETGESDRQRREQDLLALIPPYDPTNGTVTGDGIYRITDDRPISTDTTVAAVTESQIPQTPPEPEPAPVQSDPPRLLPIPQSDYSVLMANAMVSGGRIIPHAPGGDQQTLGGLHTEGSTPPVVADAFRAEFPDDEAVALFLERLASVSAPTTTVAPQTGTTAAPSSRTATTQSSPPRDARTTLAAPTRQSLVPGGLPPAEATPTSPTLPVPDVVITDRDLTARDAAPPKVFDLARYDHEVREDPETGRRILTLTLRAEE